MSSRKPLPSSAEIFVRSLLGAIVMVLLLMIALAAITSAGAESLVEFLDDMTIQFTENG